MSMGSFCYTFWIISFILPAYYQQYKNDNNGQEPTSWILNKDLIKALYIATAVITGAGAGILWTS
jgi:hypothetical protein